MSSVYYPKQNDVVDVALANFLNQYRDKHEMREQFIRESMGVYSYGAKKVHVKLEQSGQVYVRVGGDYIPIGDFIQNDSQYCTGVAIEEKRQRSPEFTRFDTTERICST